MESKSQTCRLFEAAKTIPPDAAFVSLCLKGKTMPVKSADDVLIWICKKMLLLRTSLFRCVIRTKKIKWLRPFPHGMSHPYRIAFDCYVDFDGTGMTSLLRASLIMNWMSWPVNDVSVTYTTPTPSPPAATVAKILVKQAMGKSPTPASVTATEKSIEPPGVTPTESAEGGHAGRVTLPHDDAHVVASPKPTESGHAERASRSDLNGRGERPARPPERAHAKENSENAPAAKAIPSTANGVVGTYRIEDLIDPKSLDPRRLYGKRVMRLTVEGCDYDVLSWRKCFNVFVNHCFNYHLRDLTHFNWSPNWNQGAWPLVRRIYPGPTRYEVVETTEKDPVRLVTALGMIRRACRIRPEDVRIVCAMKGEKPATTKPVESGHAGMHDPTDERGGIAGGHAGRVTLPNSDGAVKAFAADVAANYPNGFDFKETSRRLVEKRVGKRMTPVIAKALQVRMFERGDGLWLFPQMVMKDADLARLTARAKELLASEGAFAIDALRDEFADAIRNVPSGADFKRFFNAAVADAVGGRVRGHEGWRVCFRAGTDEAAGWEAIAERVRGVLEEAGDAISVADVLAQLPHLDREVVLRVCKESIRDAVVFAADDVEYVKLLSAFYLPEDFGEAVSALVVEAEASGGAVTAVTLSAALDARYGDGFRVNFGLEDEEAFHDVILKSLSDEEHVWSRDVLVAKGEKSKANIAEMFIRDRDGMFHEEEFFKFAEVVRGLTNHDMLVRRFLNRRCIRMSEKWWVSDAGFDRMFGLMSDDFQEIGERLNEYVGQSVFKSIDSVPETFYETLPPLKYEDKDYSWNKYLLTSVGVHRIGNAKVLNDGLSTYSCTAIVVPFTANVTDDVLGYVLKSFPVGYFSDAEKAFEFLKANNIRLAKKEKMLKKISEVLGIA